MAVHVTSQAVICGTCFVMSLVEVHGIDQLKMRIILFCCSSLYLSIRFNERVAIGQVASVYSPVHKRE